MKIMESTIKGRYSFRPSEKNSVLIFDAISYLFVLLFVYTAVSKFMTIGTFQKVLGHYPLLSGYTVFVSYAVPIIELIAALLLIIPRTKIVGMVGSLILMIGFLLYILFMMYSLGPSLPCSCGGIISKLSWKEHIWFNTILIILAGFALRIRN
ncbi:methylamine utilization protein MauE [Pedobacter duraquae]|uniref:Methylamine utilization protein MauE n=2 Tax=Pedobacter duraquae TaxID=425511 RepID=A0A4R6ICX7_9SPHI|nr:methylamine utilization protein MauE [Pedobacter duraquae]